jgi:hypothetical protein
MAWGNQLILIYDATTREVVARRLRTDSRGGVRVIATAVSPEGIPTLAFDESFPATA